MKKTRSERSERVEKAKERLIMFDDYVKAKEGGCTFF
jgi:hypothetical protein